VPGSLLCFPEAQKVSCGRGCYRAESGGIYASVVGQLRVLKTSEGALEYSIVTAKQRVTVVPAVNSVVTCKVLKVNPRFAACEIVCVGDQSVLEAGFKGVIRKENARSFEVDKVNIHESFRPGDVVRAKIASLGTARSYELTTADTDLGVITAMSEADEVMIAISHEEMKCPKTGLVEKRKVAKLE